MDHKATNELLIEYLKYIMLECPNYKISKKFISKICSVDHELSPEEDIEGADSMISNLIRIFLFCQRNSEGFESANALFGFEKTPNVHPNGYCIEYNTECPLIIERCSVPTLFSHNKYDEKVLITKSGTYQIWIYAFSERHARFRAVNIMKRFIEQQVEDISSDFANKSTFLQG